MKRESRWGLVLALAVAAAASPACLTARHGHLGISDSSARAELAASALVFTRSDGVYLAHGDGSGPVRLLSSAMIGRAGAVFMPALSGDGRRILFLSVEELEVRESTGRNLSLNIVTLAGPARPGAVITSWRRARLEKIAPPGADGRQEIFAAAGAGWSRKGDRIALAVNRPGGGDSVILFDAEGSPLVEHRLPDRDIARVTTLSWMKDDTGIVLGLEGDADSPGAVARLDLQRPGALGSSHLTELGAGRYPALSPDGERIAVVDDSGGQGDLVLLALDGTESARYERPAGRAPSRPFWSAGGRYLYYYSLAATGPLGLIDVTILRCIDTRTQQVFDLIRLG